MTIDDIQKEITNWRFTKYKLINLSIGIAALLLYEFVARPYYRPYIYKHQINDFHLADTIGNSLGTVATIFIFVGLFSSESQKGKFLIKTITFSLILFEIAHPLLGKAMDIWDIIATLATGAISFFLFQFLFDTSRTRHT